MVKRSCMDTSGPSALVTDAMLTRLDVYGAAAQCTDGMLAPGAGAPLLSRSYAQGQKVSLDVPPGRHTLVLTTFSDDAGTSPLGVACTEADLSAGAQVCFDLALVLAPDGGTTPIACTTSPDSCPAGLHCAGNVCVQCASDAECGNDPGAACCNGKCTNIRSDALNCNGCGMACTGSTSQCCNGACSDPQADVANCGGCGNVCTTANATPACTPSGCAVGMCNAGQLDCDGKASNGCECGTSCCVNPATSQPGCSTTHTNGVGGSYTDCFPLATPGTATTAGSGYNANMAQDAAQSDTNQVGTSYTSLTCGNNSSTITSYCRYQGANSKQGPCTCWAYSCGTSTQAGTAAACAVVGHVFANPANNGCLCVLVTDPSWN